MRPILERDTRSHQWNINSFALDDIQYEIKLKPRFSTYLLKPISRFTQKREPNRHANKLLVCPGTQLYVYKGIWQRHASNAPQRSRTPFRCQVLRWRMDHRAGFSLSDPPDVGTFPGPPKPTFLYPSNDIPRISVNM